MSGEIPDRPREDNLSREFWDSAAREDAMWHIATGVAPNREAFFISGRQETDIFLQLAGIDPDENATVLEIGCGTGRMTTRLAEMFGRVIALDISAEMLDRARSNLAHHHNIEFLHGNGADLSGVTDSSVDVVFSYIVMQHIPTIEGQLSYFRESRRVLKPGGKAAIQIRSSAFRARGLDWAGPFAHRLSGRRVFSRAWRGTRIPRSALLAAASGSAVSESGPKARVELVPHGGRHLWVLLTRGER